MPMELIGMESLPSWLGWALAAGLMAFVLGFMLISRDDRLAINLDALVFGEPGALAVGVTLLATGVAAGSSGALLFGAVFVALAALSWWTDIISF